MSGRTSTTITFLFGRSGRPRLRLIHRKTQSSNMHRGRAFIRGRSVASRWGFQMRPTLCSWEVISPTTTPNQVIVRPSRPFKVITINKRRVLMRVSVVFSYSAQRRESSDGQLAPVPPVPP